MKDVNDLHFVVIKVGVAFCRECGCGIVAINNQEAGLAGLSCYISVICMLQYDHRLHYVISLICTMQFRAFLENYGT